MHDLPQLERAVAAFAQTANSGLIVAPSAGVSIHRDLIVSLAVRFNLPAVYGEPSNAASDAWFLERAGSRLPISTRGGLR